MEAAFSFAPLARSVIPLPILIFRPIILPSCQGARTVRFVSTRRTRRTLDMPRLSTAPKKLSEMSIFLAWFPRAAGDVQRAMLFLNRSFITLEKLTTH